MAMDNKIFEKCFMARIYSFFFFFFISLVGGGDICFPKLAKLLLHTSSLAFASFCSIIYQVCIARRTD